ncbi:MAG: hypothetical protein DSZ23_01055 [Thermodesulfatator sp.]|nr:MAG: hypothetical protein DSZ23_01055 [Thermodesulfatator sp.]
MLASEPLSPGLRFLPGASKMRTSLPDFKFDDFTLIMLDCNEVERVGALGKSLVQAASSVMILDHHLGQGFCGELEKPCLSVIDKRACSTSEICFRLLNILGWEVTPAIATCFYTGVLTDTGGFRYNNTSSNTFEIARQLVLAGADPYEIALNCFESKPLSKVKLLGLALETLEVIYDGMVSVMLLTRDMFSICNARESETDDFVSYARGIDGVEVAILVKEANSGQVSVSLRSKHFVNVAELAARFGGGGHFNAAGFKTTGDPFEIKERVVALAGEYLVEKHR